MVGDPNFFLFILEEDVLAEILNQPTANNLIKGLCSNLCIGRLHDFQYAYGTILFCCADES